MHGSNDRLTGLGLRRLRPSKELKGTLTWSSCKANIYLSLRRKKHSTSTSTMEHITTSGTEDLKNLFQLKCHLTSKRTSPGQQSLEIQKIQIGHKISWLCAALISKQASHCCTGGTAVEMRSMAFLANHRHTTTLENWSQPTTPMFGVTFLGRDSKIRFKEIE